MSHDPHPHPHHDNHDDDLPAPHHGLPVPAAAARALPVPADVGAGDLRLIERLRREVRGLGFEPLGDDDVARQAARWPSAAASTAIEGNPLAAAEHALVRMFLEERLPATDRLPLIVRFAQRHGPRPVGGEL